MARPDLSYLKNLILAVFGIPCGVLTGVTGLSPAPLLQPALRWLVALSGPSLVGVVLVMVSFTSWTGLMMFGQSGHVQWLNGFMLTVGTFFGAAAAGYVVGKSPVFFVKAKPFWTFIPLALSLQMVAQATGMIHATFPAHPLLPTDGAVLAVLWSLIIGVSVGFIGFVGDLGSMLTIPLLLFLLGQTIWEAEGTALYVLVLASLPTALTHALKRTLDIKSAVALSAGGILGALFGSHLVVNSDDPMQQQTVMLICGCVLAVYSLLNLFQTPVQPQKTVE